MYNLATLTLDEIVALGDALRVLANDATTMEEVANRMVRYLYNSCRDAEGQRSCALVRFYKTHPYLSLPPTLQQLARAIMGEEAPTPQMRCLTLLATAGEEPAWNSRRDSRGHQVIPLSSMETVRRLPMVAQLVSQLGIEISSVLTPDADLMVEPQGKTHNVFYVARAAGSPFIPAQEDFVAPYRIRSVVGIGSLLSTKDLFTLVLFSKAPIGARTARQLNHLALRINTALLRFPSSSVFAAG